MLKKITLNLKNGIILLFGIIYSLISLVNHYNFRTSALDLGTYNNAIYDYAHFRFNDCMILQPQLNNLLSDHFELVIILLSPFYYLFGSYTLLVFQIVFILAGGIGIYKLANEVFLKDESLSLIAMSHFYSFIGIFTALSFDFHNNVIGAMLVPWFIYFFYKEKFGAAILIFLFQIISKENIALWSAFICIGLMLLTYKDKIKFKFAGILTILSLVYFFTVINFIIPSIANEGKNYMHLSVSYTAAGNNFGEIVLNLTSNPKLLIELLFTNHTGNPNADYVKAEMYILFLSSGGLLLFLKPQFLIMLVPIFAQKMFHNDYLKWSVSSHYTIEFIPILTIGVMFVVFSFEKAKTRYILLLTTLVISCLATIRTLDNSIVFISKSKIRFYQKGHYEKQYNVRKIHAALNNIPKNAKVSAMSPFVPHLAFRDYIYSFPVINDAEYLVLSKNESSYPLKKEEFYLEMEKLSNSPEWEIKLQENDLLILKRRN